MKKTLVTIVALFVATLLCCVSCNENNVPAARVENIPVFIEDTSLKIAVIAPFYQGNASGRGKDSKELAYRIFKDIEYALAQIMSTSDQVKYIPVDSYDIRDSYERYQAFYEREPYRNKAYAAEFAKEVHRKTGTNLLIYGLFEYGWDKIELKLASRPEG